MTWEDLLMAEHKKQATDLKLENYLSSDPRDDRLLSFWWERGSRERIRGRMKVFREKGHVPAYRHT
jgi:hypothetical protein